MAGGIDISSNDEQKYDRIEMVKAFDETKAGVKGLLDSGLIQKIPQIFVRPSEELAEELPHVRTQVQVPVIDLGGIQDPEKRKQIVEQVRIASETWGFFQVVNHGIPSDVLDGMIEGVCRFHEDNIEEKQKYYSRDLTKRVRFNSSYDLFTSKTASWRDSLLTRFSDTNPLKTDELPPSCSDSIVEYSKHVKDLGNILLGLLSEALGLKTSHLKDMGCSTGNLLACHYYPACPEPELAIGTTRHSDIGLMTILLQNQTISALQILYHGQWVDIHPTPGGIVINIGDLLQLVSNGRFRSVEHRATANQIGPRISIACFFQGPADGAKIYYHPTKELISEENPPMYREVLWSDYVAKFYATGLDNYRALDYYKI